ncbi:MAG: 4-hydroxy-tetrahydrodipicolinate synthase [Planctomycetia bacterium]|nr:4-hydroxy-tetrahydrodipicolinate synthase [Planctomycetia bacterium]
MSKKLDWLRGSFTPIVTPLRGGKIDYASFERLVEHQIAGGSHGILVNGTTAEPSLLTLSERNELAAVAVNAAGGRMPVIVATGSQSLEETLVLTESAARSGAAAVLVVTPYYVKPPAAGLVEYYAKVGASVDIPLLLYHIPGRAAVSVNVDTLCAIKDRVPHFVGMKHAVNDLALVTEALAKLTPDFRVFVGLEELSFPMLAVGAAGLMNAVGNLLPAKVATLCETVRAGDLEAARRIHFELFELNQAIFFETNPIPLKYMMKKLGLLELNEHRLPMISASAKLAERLDQVLRRAGLIV